MPALTTTSRVACASRRSPPTRIAHAGAALAVEHELLGERAGLDAQVRPLADRIEIAARRAHAHAGGDRRLAHGDAVLLGAVVVGIVRQCRPRRRLDQCLEDRLARLGVGDAKRPGAAAEALVAAAVIRFHAPEERQHVLVAPALVAHLRPAVEVLCLAAHEGHAVDRARAAQQAAARHRDAPPLGVGLGLGAVEPVGGGVGDQPCRADRNERPGMAGRTCLQEQHLVARVGRQTVGDDGARRSGADDDEVVGTQSP